MEKDIRDLWVVQDATSKNHAVFFDWDPMFDEYRDRCVRKHKVVIWQCYTVGDSTELRAYVLGGNSLEHLAQKDAPLSELIPAGVV